MKRKLLIFGFLFSAIFGIAQQQLSIYGLTHLVENSTLKPSYIGDASFELTLFSIGSNIYSNGPVYNDFIGDREAGNVLVYPTDKLSFGQDNLLSIGSSIETFRFIYNQKNWSLSIFHGAKSIGLLDYSGALLDVAINGNAPYIGQTIPLNTGFTAFSYEELGIGAAFQKGSISIGGRLKYLSGHSIVNTLNSKVSLLTDDDIYQLSLNMDYGLQAAGASLSTFNLGPFGLNFSEKENVIIQSPEFLFNLNDDLFNFSGNNGVAFDLGIDWAISEQFSLTASILNIGKINWENNARQYSANEVFEFDGLSLGVLTFDGQENISFDNVQDSLKVIQFNKKDGGFAVRLPTQYYLGLGYKLNPKWHLNLTAYHTNFKERSFTSLVLGANYQLLPAFNIGTSLVNMNETPVLLGFNAALMLGPIQLFASTDNILGAFDLTNSRTINARVGLGFTFNKKVDTIVQNNAHHYR